MEALQTITQVTKGLGISTRMLRYYEQIGLIKSKRTEGYSYRVYDGETCLRLRQILILRKLRISLKQIALLLSDTGSAGAIDVFMKNIAELDEEIDSLSTIREILMEFVSQLREKAGVTLRTDLLGDAALRAMISPLSLKTIDFKEEKTMDDLNRASEKLNQLTDRSVRIVYLPPTDVAAYQFEGDEPERHVGKVIDKFVREYDLIRMKPDLRHYGFTAPNPRDKTNAHGYEMWVTIPQGMQVPAPLVKKYFEGGLYAAQMIPMGAFEEWGWLHKWVAGSEKYAYRGNWDNANMFGWLEEHLNYVSHVALMVEDTEPEGMQLDLLIPIKEKSAEGLAE